MLKIKNILWIGALALTISSCDDFLNTPPVDRLTSDGFYQTQSQSEQGILGVYADLRQAANCEYWFMSECRSDIAWVEPNPDAYREYSEIGTFRAADNVEMFDNTWNMWYKVIYDANVAISKIPGCTYDSEDIREQHLNEAYFLRGWAYFELVRLFGYVPVVDRPMSPAEIKSVKQSAPLDIINNVVIPDLKKAEGLPYKEDMQDAKGKKNIEEQGRADKMAAKAMLARVYMTLAGFPYNDANAKSLAKTQLESVLNDSHAEEYWAPTLEEWRMQWMPSADYYNKYSVFAIQYRSGGTGNPAIFNMIPTKNFPASWTKWVCSANSIYVEKTLMHEFDREYANGKDGRGYTFGVLEAHPADGGVNAYQSPQEEMTFDDGTTATVYTKAMFYKFLPTKPKLQMMNTSYDENAMKNYDDWGVNLPIIRIEDMQLMYAELLASEGKTEDAMKIVNRIRKRANCDLRPETGVSVDDAMKYIKLERKIELMGEGIRWFDQVRYGTWKSDTEAKFDRYNYPELKSNLREGCYLYPIPRNQMNVTPGLYEQNEGYKN
ncbi:RagB/SusD family nutrient uptake outer membrane protein [Bacteroides clarus]|uniref:RagB/SusD family nutrient uptake outer membrane protein n=1 Tax=Bacteroides clarus TaxID=626929 RepID=A0A1Y4JJP9_9BACE|nr:RagB/SusD family nutrient uptake outer membrane protein [Bacteroides clarus]MCQ1545773.1 RagB/SusD family nutrient uptake outer membrane protein [Bacteroides clarus]OUP31986.1 RagB/SusD family nutrient uptake outer membrane protein [Bacteroides clarus]